MRAFLWGRKMALPNILEFIGTNISQRKFQQAQEKLLNYLGIEVPTKAEMNAAVTPKADKDYVDIALSNLSTIANKYYSTLAAANADIANIALNQSVMISEEANSGLWEKKTTGATSLTKSPYDPLSQAKAYSDIKIVLKSVENHEIIAVTEDGVQLFSIQRGLLDFNPSTGVISAIKESLDLKATTVTSEALKDHEIVAVTEDGVQLFATRKGLLDFSPSDEVKEEIGSGDTLLKPSQSIIMYGSSLTAKKGEATSTLDGFVLPDTVPSKLIAPWEAVQLELGRTVASQAAGGQNIFQSAIRQGGRTMYITLENNTLLSSGDTNITSFGDFTVFNGQSIFQSEVTIMGIPCILKPRAIGADTYAGLRLSRAFSGEAVNIPPNTPLVFKNAVDNRGWTYIIEPNANWPQSPNYSGNYDIINCVLDMIKYASGSENLSEVRYLIAGNTPARSEPIGSYTRTRKIVREQMCKEYFGDRYMDCATYMVQNAIYDAVYLGYLPSVIQADLDDIAIGVIPRRLMHDDVHYNALGAYMLGRHYSLFIKAKGW